MNTRIAATIATSVTAALLVAGGATPAQAAVPAQECEAADYWKAQVVELQATLVSAAEFAAVRDSAQQLETEVVDLQAEVDHLETIAERRRDRIAKLAATIKKLRKNR